MSIIVVGNSKGGVGKSRIAIHLAYLAIQQDSAEAVLLDTDQTGSASSWKRIRSESGLVPAVPCLSVPADPASEIKALSPKYDLLVVDIGANYYNTMLKCAILSDLMLVPCGDDQQEVEETLKVFSVFDEFRQREGKLIRGVVVLSRVSPVKEAKSTRELREIFTSSGIPVLENTLSTRAAWKNTGKTGKALHELKGKDGSAAAQAEMTAAYEEIKQLVALSDGQWLEMLPKAVD